MSYSQEVIPSSDNVFRNVSVKQVNDWGSGKRRPNEADFLLREGEVGLSVNWDKYFNINDVFVDIGLKTTKKDKTKYLDPKTFRVIKFNVSDLRNIGLDTSLDVDVIHKPISDPPPGNQAHSEICYNSNALNDVEFRLKICDLVASFSTPFTLPDYKTVELKLEECRLKSIGDENQKPC